jgi:hypothetical protein
LCTTNCEICSIWTPLALNNYTKRCRGFGDVRPGNSAALVVQSLDLARRQRRIIDGRRVKCAILGGSRAYDDPRLNS